MQRINEEFCLYLLPIHPVPFSWCPKMSHRILPSPKYYFLLASKLELISVFCSSEPLSGTLLACTQLRGVFIFYEWSSCKGTSKTILIFSETFSEISSQRKDVEQRTKIIPKVCICEDRQTRFDRFLLPVLQLNYWPVWLVEERFSF